MKNNIFYLIITLFAVTVGSCEQDKGNLDLVKSASELNADTGSVRDLIETNAYIDFDVNAVNRAIFAKSASNNEIAKAKAAVYRFYSHVQIIDGKYICDLSEAKEINISETIYNFLRNNIEEQNLNIDKLKNEGKEIIVSPIDSNYLNSLLE